MTGITENNCRFCLTSLEENYEVIEETISEVFDVLLLKLDLSISKEPILCLSCKDSIQNALEFKNTYNSFDMDCAEINKSMSPSNNDHKVCRFCMKYFENNSFSILTSLKKFGENFLKTFFSELDLNVIQKFVVCEPCMKSLQSYYNFAKLCYDTEEKIRKYCEFRRTDIMKQVDLSDVAKFVEVCNKIPVIKKEDLTENKEYFNYDINNLFMKIEEKPNIGDGSMNDSGYSGNEMFTYLVKSEGDVNYDINLVKVEGQPNITDERIQDEEVFENFIDTKRDVSYDINNTLMKIEGAQDMEDNEIEADLPLENETFQHGTYPYLTQESGSGTNVYRCETCTFQTVHKWNIKRHVLAHESWPEENVHKCNMCSYQTKYKGNLNNHILTHKSCLEVIMHKCEQCTFQTKHKLSLKRHQLSHKEKIPELLKDYQCEVCTFKTKHKINLKHHMLTHKDSSEVVMYKCEKCTFESKHKRALRKHILIHNKNCSEASMFKCKTCAFQTTHKWNLKRHMQRYKSCSEAIANEDDLCINNI